MIFVFLLYTILFYFFIASDYQKPLMKYHLLFKTLNSIGFILTATWAMYVSGNFSFYLTLLPAFFFCLGGDVLLAVPGKYKDYCFLGGLISFLVGHIFFIWGFHYIAPIRWYDFIFPSLMVICAIFIIRLPKMEMRGASIPVIIYSFFVSMLLSKAVSILVTVGPSRQNLLIAVGALFFFISDFILLFNIFYTHKFKWGPFFCGIFYYYGMFLLALSIMA